MPIAVECPGCRALFQVDPRHSGRTGRCPHCRGAVPVPDPSAASSPHQAKVAQAVEDDLVPLVDDPPTVRAGSRRPAEPGDDGPGTGYGLAGEAMGQMTARVRSARAARTEAPPPATPAPAPGRAGARSGAEPKPAQPRWARNPREILAAFDGVIEPVRPTLAYRAGIVVVAVVMLVLPLVYLALAGLLGLAVVAAIRWALLFLQQVRVNQWTLLIAVSPALGLGTVLAFLVKPFFARSRRDDARRAIDPNREPLVFAFVHGVCESVGAPTPARIEVNCEVNASARLTTWALHPSKELVLTIGLPLVAGLTLRQLTGVMAHEFGHFSQGAGMRLQILIRSINLWFARVVYERDHWDEAIVRWSGPDYGLWRAGGYLIRGAVWATRRILWLLMQVGRLVSGIMARQMEFDADRYEARLVGSTTFEATSDQMRYLGVAWQLAGSDLETHWRERRLPDDLSRLTLLKLGELPDALRESIQTDARQRRAGLFDTHPADSARIAAAHQQGPDGLFRLDGPATDLFRDFDALSRAATFDHYQSLLGSQVTPEQLYPVADAVLNREVEREGNEAIGRYFLRALHPVQTLPLADAYPKAPGDPRASRQRLVELRRLLLNRRPAQLTLVQRFGELAERTLRAEAANAALEAGRKFPAATFELPQPTLKAARSARAEVEATRSYLLSELDLFADLASERLRLALALLEHEAVAARVADGPLLRDEARALYPAGAIVAGRAVGQLGLLAPTLGALLRLIELHQAQKNKNDPPLVAAVLAVTAGLHTRLRGLREALGDHEFYPFEHAEAGMTLARFVVPALPSADDVGGLINAASEANNRLLDLHRRILGRLSSTAEAVERIVHLPPLDVPSDISSDDPA